MVIFGIETIFYSTTVILGSSFMGYTGGKRAGAFNGDPVAACADFRLLRQKLIELRRVSEDATLDEVVRLYWADPGVGAISPNQHFDELWYRAQNADVAAAIAAGACHSGFQHFVTRGYLEGRWPNQTLYSMVGPPASTLPRVDEEDYLKRHPGAEAFLLHFPIMTVSQHYNIYGRFLGFDAQTGLMHQVSRPDELFCEISAGFDPDFYRRTYLDPAGLDQVGPRRFCDDPFTHYLVTGMQAGHSPNAAFDESFYRAFYPDVRDAVQTGQIPCGFYHYAVAGAAENRLPHYDRKLALEARVPGVTRPLLMDRAEEISLRMRAPAISVSLAAPSRIWALLPTLNPDITFGGYRSVFELMLRLCKGGWHLTIVCTEDRNASKEYYLRREECKSLRDFVREVEVIEYKDSGVLQIGSADLVLTYSLWDLYTAQKMREASPATQVILLAQEYEPIFYDNGAPRALLEQAYRIPHFPLINSNFLLRFFADHRIGVFGEGQVPQRGRNYEVFEHRINRLPSQTADEMRARSSRLLVAYARPEAHAARNMFEILLLALKVLCGEGLFGPEWSFIGLGALTDIADIPLGGGHVLEIHPKMSEAEYARHIKAMDIGVSLMFAPHPSVVPFEFATTGALVVTNVYENRSAADLVAVSGNIIPAHPGITGIADAIREAANRVDDVEARVSRLYHPLTERWDDIFNIELLHTVFGPPPQALSAPQAMA